MVLTQQVFERMIVGRFDENQQLLCKRTGFCTTHDTDSNHWLTISNIGCQQPNVINIYDSMFRSCSSHIQQQIACIMNTKYSHIQANFVNVNHQSGSSDCGVFAVAFAVSFCYGLQPAKFCYDQNNMRSHLIHCLERGRMELFPVRRERRENSVI